jgi:hypothetical protein
VLENLTKPSLTQAEFDALPPCGNVPLTCGRHPLLRWTARKSATIRCAGLHLAYPGSQTYFLGKVAGTDSFGYVPACACESKNLLVVIREHARGGV